MVIHSATKYLNGHSDLVGGVIVVGENKELADQIAFLQNSVGAIAGAFDSFLVLRSLKTLALRMERHCANALEIARWLEEQPQVKSVMYPGLKSHPQHDLARTQMRGFGGMVTIVLKTDLAGTKRFLKNTHLFALAESLGGVESLINHPALMTHASVPIEKRGALGIGDSLVRLSVGVVFWGAKAASLRLRAACRQQLGGPKTLGATKAQGGLDRLPRAACASRSAAMALL